jgi:hypothetical protein
MNHTLRFFIHHLILDFLVYFFRKKEMIYKLYTYTSQCGLSYLLFDYYMILIFIVI